jgi:hypothetical protein
MAPSGRRGRHVDFPDGHEAAANMMSSDDKLRRSQPRRRPPPALAACGTLPKEGNACVVVCRGRGGSGSTRNFSGTGPRAGHVSGLGVGCGHCKPEVGAAEEAARTCVRAGQRRGSRPVAARFDAGRGSVERDHGTRQDSLLQGLKLLPACSPCGCAHRGTNGGCARTDRGPSGRIHGLGRRRARGAKERRGLPGGRRRAGSCSAAPGPPNTRSMISWPLQVCRRQWRPSRP